jgi:hypothetical protein
LIDDTDRLGVGTIAIGNAAPTQQRNGERGKKVRIGQAEANGLELLGLITSLNCGEAPAKIPATEWKTISECGIFDPRESPHFVSDLLKEAYLIKVALISDTGQRNQHNNAMVGIEPERSVVKSLKAAHQQARTSSED